MQSLDLTIVRGVTNDPVLLVFKDSNGDQVDLTGWSAFSQARTNPKARPSLDLKATILPTGTVLYGTTGPGRVTIASFSDDETSKMNDEQLGYDVVLEDTGGARSGPYVSGTIIISTPNTHQ
jgi:hypothetical protein